MMRTARSGPHLCPICASKEPKALWGRKWGFEIRRCPACGVGETLLPDGFNPLEIYSEHYFKGERADGYADYVGSAEVIRLEAQRLIDRLVEMGRGGGRLLDVGCAYGFFLDVARERFNVAGVEVCEAAAASCRERGLDVETGVLSHRFLMPRKPFDVVVMLDVIEHLPNPLEVLQLLHGSMSVGGHLMITTGDWGSAMARVAGTHWRLLTPPQHLFYFHRHSLRTLLERSGFRLVEVARPAKRVSVGLIAYQLQRLFGMTPRPLGALSRMSVRINLFDAMRVTAIRVDGVPS